MNDAVADHLTQRAALERGLGVTFVLSTAGHLLIVAALALSAWLTRAPDRLNVALGVAVPLPAGGGGPMNPDPAPPAPVKAPPPKVEPPAPAPEPPRQEVIKPPRDERNGLPPLESKKPPKKATPTPPPRAASTPRAALPAPGGRAPGSVPHATGTNPATPGLGIVGPVGPGVPGGTDPGGDWYLASVQRKIWVIWTRQMKSGFVQPITVTLTIHADGSLEDGSVRVVQGGGTPALDFAAQRAVLAAAPFAPFPRTYGTNRITIQAVFQPTP